MLVQFGNNWIQKIPLTAKLAVLGIFFIQLFPNWTACSPITYTNPGVGGILCHYNIACLEPVPVPNSF